MEIKLEEKRDDIIKEKSVILDLTEDMYCGSLSSELV